MTSEPAESYVARYGRWAVIAGGSDGLGVAFAHELAGRGMNCLLIARRPEPLEEAAQAVRRASTVEVRTLSLDLGAPEAFDRLMEATADLDLGIVVFNAGAESSGRHFLDQPVEVWLETIDRNIVLLTKALHAFARRMRDQGRGGLVIVGSNAAFGGGARGSIYTASKGFALNLGESLWAELKPFGVDVINPLFLVVDTPRLRETMAKKGLPMEAIGAAAPDALARATLDALPDGPVFHWDEKPGDDDSLTSGHKRRARAQWVTDTLNMFYA
jgi:short-subunit dehydrogenase